MLGVKCLLALFAVCSAPAWSSEPRIVEIPVVRFGDVSYDEFYNLGPHHDRPVVISRIPLWHSPCFGKLRKRANSSAALLSKMRDECAGIIRLDKMSASDQRTGKTPVDNVKFKRFVEYFAGNLTMENELTSITEHHGPVLGLEYALIPNCNWSFWSELRIPPFFTGDISIRTNLIKGMPYGEDPAYPALTFAEPGFYTKGHVDNPNNEIWMGMCYGSKTARILPMTVVAEHWGRGAHLERLAHGKLGTDELGRRVVLNLMFKEPLDLFNESYLSLELPGVPIYEATLQDGEVLYLPTSAAHAIFSHDRGLYVISSFVDFNDLIAPNPSQLAVKLASCQRCHLLNFSTENGGEKIDDIRCRRRKFCHNLVSWLLDDRMRVPMLDFHGPAISRKERPRTMPLFMAVAKAEL
eukprot:TRINITY_DN32022_c0_g1_i1.p1 TRINITY_DN32022_c0_g1~~TRINITY_DN32022_c0_g1_i1.p1  ORF type:complete len:410 (+),score=32.02 TRINITY_DN32022_c0_g1_i1:118-1347(+)